MVKQEFITSLSEVIAKDEIDSFISSINNPISSFVRYNNKKNITNIFNGTPVSWCAEGVRLDERIVFTTDPHFHGGTYYVQEASSMFNEQLFEKLIFPEIGREIKVLDLCAAPGGKSTHISSLIDTRGLLVANEVIKSRAAILKENIIKWGIGNCVVTSCDAQQFAALPSFFDVVVVDTPCSGEGMFRKSEKAREEWSLSNVELCSKRSRRIVSDVWDTLREGGFMIYSTCTFNRKENEDNVKWIIDELGGELVEERITDFKNIIVSDYGYRFHPNRVDSEGYFAALIRKTESTARRRDKKERIAPLVKEKNIDLSEWLKDADQQIAVTFNSSIYAIDKDMKDDLAYLAAKLPILYLGTEIGEMFGNKLRPSHALSLSTLLNRERVEVCNLPLETALNYLRRQTIDCDNMSEGYNIVGYAGTPIGWVKKIGTRANNLYPKDSRILNL